MVRHGKGWYGMVSYTIPSISVFFPCLLGHDSTEDIWVGNTIVDPYPVTFVYVYVKNGSLFSEIIVILVPNPEKR